MKNRIVVLAAVLLLFGCLTPVQKFDPEKVSENKNTGSQTLIDIENELKYVLSNNGEISPQRVAEIKETLKQFENISEKERLNSIITVLNELEEKNYAQPIVQKQIPAEEPPPINKTPELDFSYKQMQNEVKQLEELNGELSPEGYDEFLAKLNSLSVEGYDLEKIRLLNESFNKVAIDPTPPCESNPNPVFSYAIVDPEIVVNILPPPNIHKSSGHLKTHSYVDTESSELPIYAPANMTLIGGAYYEGGPYYMDFQISCEVKIRLAHITEPVQKLKEVFPKEPQKGTHATRVPRVLIKEGELIAHTGGPPHVLNMGFDFGLYNSKKPNRYASSSNPEITGSEIYTTADCPYDYFIPDLRARYRSKFYITKAEGMIADGTSFCQ